MWAAAPCASRGASPQSRSAASAAAVAVVAVVVTTLRPATRQLPATTATAVMAAATPRPIQVGAGDARVLRGAGGGGRGSNLALCQKKGRQKQGCCGIGDMNGWGGCNNKAGRRYRGIDVERAEARKCNGAVEEPAESACVLSLTRAQQHATVLPEGSVPQPAHTSHTSHMFSHFSTLFSRVQQRVRCIRRRLRLPRGV